jgi:Holliday junction resolvase-like predicted endonuclease
LKSIQYILVYDPSDHPSLIEIKKQNDGTQKNVFEKVTTDKVEKIMNNINIKKATGADGIPAKLGHRLTQTKQR